MMPAITLAVSAHIGQTLVLVLEDHKLIEVLFEREDNQRLVGNIYNGRVEDVLPGMSAAFVNIGHHKNAFLYLDDAAAVKPGQNLLVQVYKEPEGGKGARIARRVSLAGRYLVLLPDEQQIGYSRQINNEQERARLAMLAGDWALEGMGVIFRTAAAEAEPEAIRADLDFLRQRWLTIKAAQEKQAAPALLHRDGDLVERVIRDRGLAEQVEIIVDDAELYERIVQLIAGFPNRPEVKLHQQPVPLLETLGAAKELHRAMRERVWLDCGGYLVLNQTEALLCIDVNTGKFTGKADPRQTVLQTNLEAAAEIARQLRLRNVGGMIVIDFIDMHHNADRDQVLDQLKTSLRPDRTKTTVLGFTRLGLVEMTRRRSKRALQHTLEQECPHCRGRGRLVASDTVAFLAAQTIRAAALEPEAAGVVVRCHPDVAERLTGPDDRILQDLTTRCGCPVRILPDASLRPDETFVAAASDLNEDSRSEWILKRVGVDKVHSR